MKLNNGKNKEKKKGDNKEKENPISFRTKKEENEKKTCLIINKKQWKLQ